MNGQQAAEIFKRVAELEAALAAALARLAKVEEATATRPRGRPPKGSQQGAFNGAH